MITGAQIRSARAALGWSVQELADRAAVATKTIMRMESVVGVPQSRTKTLLDIKAALESGGIEFVDHQRLDDGRVADSISGLRKRFDANRRRRGDDHH
jgi:ribosome-binding protein aMBF1 (putative translation factor)